MQLNTVYTEVGNEMKILLFMNTRKIVEGIKNQTTVQKAHVTV
jgi:hypothetical protein